MSSPCSAEVAAVDAVDHLLGQLGHRFSDDHLLVTGLRHRSWCAEHGGVESNERLEFLGDAVLGLVIAELLYRWRPHMDEGDLARLRAELVNSRALAAIAREIGLGDAVMLGRGEEQTDGRAKTSILADTLEAVIGALHLDGGLPVAAAVIERLWRDRLDQLLETGATSDHKSRLQESAARLSLPPPVYRMSESGPDHDKWFIAVVSVGPRIGGAGEGRTKKDAEQLAAAQALGAIESPGAWSEGADEDPLEVLAGIVVTHAGDAVAEPSAGPTDIPDRRNIPMGENGTDDA